MLVKNDQAPISDREMMFMFNFLEVNKGGENPHLNGPHDGGVPHFTMMVYIAITP
jgi:hypothetical protein